MILYLTGSTLLLCCKANLLMRLTETVAVYCEKYLNFLVNSLKTERRSERERETLVVVREINSPRILVSLTTSHFSLSLCLNIQFLPCNICRMILYLTGSTLLLCCKANLLMRLTETVAVYCEKYLNFLVNSLKTERRSEREREREVGCSERD
jgi:tryptophanase